MNTKKTGRPHSMRDQRISETSGQGQQRTDPTPSITTMGIEVNDTPTCVDSLAVLANDTLALASRTGRRSDARATVYLHRAVYYAHLAIEALFEGAEGEVTA